MINPNLSERLSWLQMRIQPGCYTSVQHIEQKQPRWKTGNKKQIHARYHLPACRRPACWLLPCRFSTRSHWICHFKKTETIMLKRRIWHRTATHTQKVFKSPKTLKGLSQVQSTAFLPLTIWVTGYNYEQWAQPLHIILNIVCIRGCL